MREDLNAEQWAQFVRETDGHLDNVRRILVSAQGDRIGALQLECLARSFHSIQWLSNSMGALAMEMLASCAEAFLAGTDEGLPGEGAALVAQLLGAVDDLKMLRENEAGEHAAAVSPRARVQGVLDDPIWQMPEDEFRLGVFPDRYAGVEASNDTLDLFGFFMELVQDNVPALSVLTSPECQARSSCSGCDGCKKMTLSVESIRYAAEAMGYAQIKCALDEVRAHMPACGSAIAPGQREQIIERLPGVLALIGSACIADCSGS